MGRLLAAIMILFVFTSFQFGKLASYLYCKWQLEIVKQQKSCDCNTHLVAMFDHSAPGEGVIKASLNEIPVEYFGHSFAGTIVTQQIIRTSCFAEYDSPLLKSYIAPAFHPPAV